MPLYLSHPLSLEHDTGPHPENANRIRAIEARLQAEGWLGLERVEAPEATREQIERVHTPEVIDRVASLAQAGGGSIDLDTTVSARSYDAALRGAGAAVAAVDALLGGEGRFAFCGMRPPGHHAERAASMGFCLFNNIAVGVRHALAEHSAERALIIDFDVHHGNGTQDVFYSEDDVLFCSIHQSPLYPGTGRQAEIGSGDGAGFNVNLPVAPGSGNAQFTSLIEHVVLPLARAHQPGLIAVSAGYDAHRADPLADCTVDEGGYADISALLRDLAAELEVPVLVCLEGGYAVEALAESVNATIATFTGSRPAPRSPRGPAAPHLARLTEHWPALAR